MKKNSAAFDEAIILENATPINTDKLVLEVFDKDSVTSDDKLASAQIEMPKTYGENMGERTYDLMHNGNKCGTITIDQVHFIKQKLIRYTGPCKCCCCCLG
jgi:Ca2+-dependent lipid-binding protein